MNDLDWGTVAIRTHGPIRRLRLTRPSERNAISTRMVDELRSALDAIAADPDARVVILEGEGKSFCAGADIADMRESGSATHEENLSQAERIAELFRTLDALPRPVIARVHGHALGGGAGLVACSDVVIASEETAFAFSEVRLGIIPAMISAYVLPKIGPSHARRYFLSGERFSAEEARRIGLVSEVVAFEDLDDRVAELADEMLLAGPEAQSRIKRLIHRFATEEYEGYRLSTPREIAEARMSPEGQAGLAAFLAKTQAPWVPRPEPLGAEIAGPLRPPPLDPSPLDRSTGESSSTR